MAVADEIDVELLKSESKKTYACVSDEPGRDFIFPTGRASAEDLGSRAELANVTETAVESRSFPGHSSAAGRSRGQARDGAGNVGDKVFEDGEEGGLGLDADARSLG
jgi:hypothetical protein